MHDFRWGRWASAPAAVLVAAALFALTPSPASAIDVCGNGICAGTAFPPETCNSCPQDCGPCPPPPPVSVVNMIPLAQSGETWQDSEPSIAVNPANPLKVAGTALTKLSTPATLAPLYVSLDGGNTWRIDSNVASQTGTTSGATLAFGDTSNDLYVAIRESWTSNPSVRASVWRYTDFSNPAADAFAISLHPNSEQPFVSAKTVGGLDRVYIGRNDRLQNGKTASVDRSLNASTTRIQDVVVTSHVVEKRTPCFLDGDGTPVRATIHADGTAYLAFFSYRSPACGPFTADLVVVRDENGTK